MHKTLGGVDQPLVAESRWVVACVPGSELGTRRRSGRATKTQVCRVQVSLRAPSSLPYYCVSPAMLSGRGVCVSSSLVGAGSGVQLCASRAPCCWPQSGSRGIASSSQAACGGFLS